MKKVYCLLIFTIIVSGCAQEPKTFEELKKAGEKEFIKENYPAARKHFVKALKLKQSNRDILYFLGLSYQREYLMDSAIYYLKRADLIHPNDREINLAIYPIAVELQEWENALKAISVLITTGDPIEPYYETLADLNMKAEHYIISFIYLKKLLEAEPDNPNRYMQLANIASQIDSIYLAIDLMNQAIEKFGDNEQFLLNQGIYYSVIRDYNTSEKIFRSLLSRDTSSIPTKVNLANVLTKQDDRNKKLEGYKLYKEIQFQVTDVFKIDSTVSALEKELNIK